MNNLSQIIKIIKKNFNFFKIENNFFKKIEKFSYKTYINL